MHSEAPKHGLLLRTQLTYCGREIGHQEKNTKDNKDTERWYVQFNSEQLRTTQTTYVSFRIFTLF